MNNHLLVEVVSSAAWSLAGLIVGFALGRVTREVHEVHTLVAPLDERLTMIESPPHPMRRDGDKTRRRDRWLSIALITFAIASVITAAVSVNRRSAIADCQVAYNERVVVSIKARQLANDADRAAIVTLVRTIANIQSNTSNAADRLKPTNAALRKYIDQSSETDRLRKDKPLPVVDSCPPGLKVTS